MPIGGVTLSRSAARPRSPRPSRWPPCRAQAVGV